MVEGEGTFTQNTTQMGLSPAQWIEMGWEHSAWALCLESLSLLFTDWELLLLKCSLANGRGFCFSSLQQGFVHCMGWMDGCLQHHTDGNRRPVTWLFPALTLFTLCFFTFALSVRNRPSPYISTVATIKKLRGINCSGMDGAVSGMLLLLLFRMFRIPGCERGYQGQRCHYNHALGLLHSF